MSLIGIDALRKEQDRIVPPIRRNGTTSADQTDRAVAVNRELNVGDASKLNGIDPDRAKALRPLTVSELLECAHPKAIIRGVLQERSLNVVYGQTGSGKTFLILDAALAIVLGSRWFRRRVRKGGVVYVAGEGHAQLRIRAHMQHHGISPADLNGFRVVASSVNLLGHQSDDVGCLIATLRACAAEIGGISLVVVDTLNAAMAGGDENGSADMGLMIAAAKRIMDALGCAFVFVHHSGKTEERGSRGHSSLKAALDGEILVTNNGQGRIAEITKYRDGETGQQFHFRLESVDLGPDPDPEADDGDRIGSCVVVPLDDVPQTAKAKKATTVPKSAELALRALREAIGERGQALPGTSAIPTGARGVTVEQWRERYYVISPLNGEKADTRLKRFNRATDALLNAGAAMVCNDWVWLA